MPQGVIFDMDGVLVASGPAHAESWRVTARRHGREISDAFFLETFGRPNRDIIPLVWGEDVTAERMREIGEEKERVYRELVTGMVPLMIGCREVLARLGEAGFVMAVATSGSPENLKLVLEETGIGGHFRTTVTARDVPRGKPAPDCFLLAAERCGLAPSACVVVEDAPAGIAAARAAGMPAIGLVGTHPAERLREAGATRVATALREVTPGVVRELLG